MSHIFLETINLDSLIMIDCKLWSLKYIRNFTKYKSIEPRQGKYINLSFYSEKNSSRES